MRTRPAHVTLTASFRTSGTAPHHTHARLGSLAAAALALGVTAPEQIHIAYTGVVGELSVDFVSQAADGFVAVASSATGPFAFSNSTSFECKAQTLPSYTCTENYGFGYYTAVNATHATWKFKTVEASGPGPKDYADSLTIIKA